jgi:hypothetical protein
MPTLLVLFARVESVFRKRAAHPRGRQGQGQAALPSQPPLNVVGPGLGVLSHVGPMTWTVDDAALLLDVITAPDSRDSSALAPPPES